MKVKKPIILAVVILAVLVVTLILPATALGKAEGQAVNWVANGQNSNNTFRAGDWQGGHSVLVKEMPDGTLEGHGFLVGVKPQKSSVVRAIALLNYDPFTMDPIDVFRVEGDYKVAEFVLDFGPDSPLPFRYFKMVLMDGGEPKTADVMQEFMGLGGWVPMGPPMTPFSNIQIHMGE
jgi:hypothetical protein